MSPFFLRNHASVKYGAVPGAEAAIVLPLRSAIFATLLRPDGGSARVLGYDVAKSAGEVRRRVGLTGQFASVDDDLTGTENLLFLGRLLGYKGKQAKERADTLLEAFGLSEAAGRLVKTYSGGMRRRIDIAASIVVRPDLIFLDEPTTGLDPQARHVVWQKLRALKRAGVTMLLTTHYMEEAERLCDRLLIMDRGKVLARGSPAGLIEEHIGREVIECFPGRGAEGSALRALVEAADHVERAGDEVYAFFRDPEDAHAVLPHLGPVDFVHRRATLEDVFLRLTGRELRE